MTRAARLPALLAAGVVAACSGVGLPPQLNPGLGGAVPIQGEDRLLRLTEWTPPPGQLCAVSESEVPPPEALIDTEAVRVALDTMPGPRRPERGGLLLHVSADTGGPEFWRMETTMAADRADALENAIRSARRPEPPRTVGRLLATVDGGVIRFRTGPSLACSPLMVNAGEIHMVFRRASRSGAARGRVALLLYVEPDGSVGDVEIDDASGDRYLDEVGAGIAYRAIFYPALVDRVPVAVWVPLDFTARY